MSLALPNDTFWRVLLSLQSIAHPWLLIEVSEDSVYALYRYGSRKCVSAAATVFALHCMSYWKYFLINIPADKDLFFPLVFISRYIARSSWYIHKFSDFSNNFTYCSEHTFTYSCDNLTTNTTLRPTEFNCNKMMSFFNRCFNNFFIKRS